MAAGECSLELGCLGSNPSSSTYQLGDLGHVTKTQFPHRQDRNGWDIYFIVRRTIEDGGKKPSMVLNTNELPFL